MTLLALAAGAAGTAMPSAPAGVAETGAPSFVVLGPEALGLSTSPIDLHLLPDGRILVVSQRELAFGDGRRWETFHAQEGEPPIFASVAVDRDGRIYTGERDLIGRIELGDGNTWRFAPAVEVPPAARAQQATLTQVVAFDDHWYWYGGNGAILRWRPGQPPVVVGSAGAIECIFEVGGEAFISDESSGALNRLAAGGTVEAVAGVEVLVSESVTCTVPLPDGRLLAGTASAGLKLFDGRKFTPFPSSSILGPGHRITDLCRIPGGFFAASIDTVGIVFFDAQGRVVQVLERSLDHRLARVQRLHYSAAGVLWALLNDGVARVEFPSPVSHFEPLIASGLTFAQPVRHDGKLWIIADGHAQRGVYNPEGRLERFEEETPAGRYLFTLASVAGRLFGANETGLYVHGPDGWRLAVPGLVNARVGVAPTTPAGDIFYVARGEYGSIRETGGNYVARRIPCPELGDSYNSEIDAAGIGWVELGLSRIGRFDPHGGLPQLRILTQDDGLGQGWAEIYIFDGVARVHLANRLYRYDEAQHRAVEDHELLARLPYLANAGGRPVTDHLGRVWQTVDGAMQVLDHTAAGRDRRVEVAPVGFAPTTYTAQDDGVMWLFERRRLARLDSRQPVPPPAKLRALITSVALPGSNRRLHDPGAALAPLSYADNSLVIYFAAPANPFAASVDFEFLLEGADTHWVPTGSAGSAAFNRLKEGDYTFRVRPVVRGAPAGEEARLRFTVRPPWYRTPVAWTAYAVSALGLVAFLSWLATYLQRRENERLEQVVTRRTAELNATNAQLGRQIEETTQKTLALTQSEERFRRLNVELESRVAERTAALSHSRDELQLRESLFRLIFEHAPVGICWKRADLGDVYHLNSRFRSILALPDATLRDYARLTALIHPDDLSAHVAHQRDIENRASDSYRIEERFVPGPDRVVWGSLSVAVVRDASGQVVQEIGILEDISERKRSEAALAKAHRELLEVSRQAGMAEVATGVLHNVGNVLNSVNVSATLVAESVRQTKAHGLAKLATLVGQHRGDLAGFLAHDERGRLIPDYLDTLAAAVAEENRKITAELDQLRRNVEHMKEIVAMQQAYARTSGVLETVSVPDMVEDALRINAGSLARHDISIARDYQARPVLTTDKHKVIQILINLVRNAKYACDESGRPDKQITVRLTRTEHAVRIAVEDNGVGIPPENLTRIFNHGFTTRAQGHGFGLHSGALAAKELGGTLTAASAGRGHGATFTVEIPFKPEASA